MRPAEALSFLLVASLVLGASAVCRASAFSGAFYTSYSTSTTGTYTVTATAYAGTFSATTITLASPVPGFDWITACVVVLVLVMLTSVIAQRMRRSG
jgi:hypothetical protein